VTFVERPRFLQAAMARPNKPAAHPGLLAPKPQPAALHKNTGLDSIAAETWCRLGTGVQGSIVNLAPSTPTVSVLSEGRSRDHGTLAEPPRSVQPAAPAMTSSRIAAPRGCPAGRLKLHTDWNHTLNGVHTPRQFPLVCPQRLDPLSDS